jgi:hypothetical protein
MLKGAFLVVLLLGLSGVGLCQHPVRSYVKKNGTYVQPHHRTSPDRTQRNNYSTKGNLNPYTGKRGTKKATH